MRALQYAAFGVAHANTILDRGANACADFALRDQLSNCARSPSVNVTRPSADPSSPSTSCTTSTTNY